jgi:hypothetical protein
MYYHCRPLKFVEYGKVYPPPIKEIDEFMIMPYRWLGHYCSFFPQVWLSRSYSSITGFKNKYTKEKDGILFGFDIIQGFPLSFQPWELLIGTLMNLDDHSTIEQLNRKIQQDFIEIEKDCIKEKWDLDGEIKKWVDCGRNIDTYLKKHVFVEVDQVVVPSLNLKVAKKIICRDERQKKALRKMGFIEDRIQIRNIKIRKW